MVASMLTNALTILVGTALIVLIPRVITFASVQRVRWAILMEPDAPVSLHREMNAPLTTTAIICTPVSAGNASTLVTMFPVGPTLIASPTSMPRGVDALLDSSKARTTNAFRVSTRVFYLKDCHDFYILIGHR